MAVIEPSGQQPVRAVRLAAVVALVGALGASAALGQTAGRHPGALDEAGLYALRDHWPQLDGSGARLAAVCRSATYLAGQPQNDYFPNTAHRCFADATVVFETPLASAGGISEHATAVAAILVGHDPAAIGPDGAVGLFQGAAPGATLHVREFWRFVRDHLLADERVDADVVSLSLGMTFDDWWTRGLQYVAERDALVIVAPAGNGRAVCDPLLYPAAGANVIAVGVVDAVASGDGLSLEAFGLAQAAHSSAGPSVEGRCKPDLVAASNVLVPDGDDGYRPAGNWSSYATPIVAGTAAILIQQARLQPELADVPGRDGFGCLVRAVLMNSARKLPFWHKGRAGRGDDHDVPLDYLQGAGMLDAVAALEQFRAGPGSSGSVRSAGWDLNQLEKSGLFENVYAVAADPGDAYLEATLVWNRHFESRYPFGSRSSEDADLRLEVWAVDPDNPDNARRLDYSDSPVDNVEHIHCPLDPEYPRVEIIVRCSGQSEPIDDGVETYALAWRTTAEKWTANVWWGDLNADGTADRRDHLIAALLDLGGEVLEAEGFSDLLGLGPDRVRLLRAHWSQWKPLVTAALEPVGLDEAP